MDPGEDDDEIPQLSAATLAALQEHYNEQAKLAEILSAAAEKVDELEASQTQKPILFENELSNCFPEDWQMSQFWYDEETSLFLAEKVKALAEDGTKMVACVSCPSVFRACGVSPNVHLFEYDKRFAAFGSSYIFYDYNFPQSVPQECLNAYSVIVVDPPFLAEECLQKVSETVKLISKANAKIILCTGAVMEKDAEEFLSVTKTAFVPQHKNNLGNDFACYTNFDL